MGLLYKSYYWCCNNYGLLGTACLGVSIYHFEHCTLPMEYVFGQIININSFTVHSQLEFGLGWRWREVSPRTELEDPPGQSWTDLAPERVQSKTELEDPPAHSRTDLSPA